MKFAGCGLHDKNTNNQPWTSTYYNNKKKCHQRAPSIDTDTVEQEIERKVNKIKKKRIQKKEKKRK